MAGVEDAYRRNARVSGFGRDTLLSAQQLRGLSLGRRRCAADEINDAGVRDRMLETALIALTGKCYARCPSDGAKSRKTRTGIDLAAGTMLSSA